MSLRAHLRSRFNKQTPPTEGTRQKRSNSSGSDDVNSSTEELSLSDQATEGGSPSFGRKKYDKGAGEPSSPGSRRKKEQGTGSGQSSNEESRPQRSGSTTSKTGQWEDSEKSIYETQLRTLQEQLVDTMIENQTLQSEITKFKENGDMTRLLQMLDHEKEKSAKLSQDCEELQQQLENMERRSYSMEEHPSSVDTAEEADAVDFASVDTGPQPVPRKPTLIHQVQEWLLTKMYETISDFTEDPEDEKTTGNEEGEELAVKKLKANIKRFKAGYQPIVQWLKAVGNLFGWKSTPASFLAFVIYMYAVAKGWLISLMLGLALWHLTKTYMISKGFAVKFSLLPYSEEEENSDMDKQLGLSDKFQLVLLVARRVQNYMGSLADGLEKIQNLVMWGSPEATQKLYTGLLCAFIASVILPGEWFFICGGIFLGLKVFITDNIFKRFPRVRAKYDSSYIVWQSLPTHTQKQRKNTLERRRKYIIPAVVTEQTPAEGQEVFLEMFSLPSEELPLPGWHSGKRCTQIVRDKSVSFKNGRLYLTRSFLCFERSRLKSRVDKHIVIPLTDIITIEKVKPFFLLPGPGMSIEIRVVSEEKPYIFGAILNRDEVHAVILRQVCSVRDARLKDNKSRHKETSMRDSGAAGTSTSSNQ